MIEHSFLQRLDSSLLGLVPPQPVELRGEWSETLRRTYKTEAQLGTGAGPFVDVVDRRWNGALSCSIEISGIAFLLTADRLYWAKAPAVSLTLPVSVLLHAYARYKNEVATFTASMGGAGLPGVPVSNGENPKDVCNLGANSLTTGRVTSLAQASGGTFFVLLFQRSLLKVGRNRLWHLREEITTLLPPDIGKLLTRRRDGSV